MNILNSITCPIDNKVSLIEASAGTGKTYNIQNIYVRMIMENGFPIESILVVTFTDAATRELKSRIRSILNHLNDFFEGRDVKDIDRISNLATNGNIDRSIKHSRIISALRNFDKSSIFTIHGFCKKSLDENVFSTSAFFKQELQKNNERIIEKIIQNFIRKYFYQNSEIEHFLNEYHGINFESCLKFIKRIKNKSNFIFDHKYKHFDLISEIDPIKEKMKNIYSRDRIIEKLSPSIISQAKGNYNHQELNIALDTLENFIQDNIEKDTFQQLSKFTNFKIEESLKKGNLNPGDELFDLSDQLFEHIAKYKFSIFQKLYDFFIKEFENEKYVMGFRTFDDLIKILEQYLQTNPHLNIKIAKEYSSVLIDEFQDTDSLQYSIFSQIFIQNDKPTFLIGDPKQAIYSFRGGDIYAYKKATEDVEQTDGNLYTLLTNYRSTKNMVQAVNQLYKSLPSDNEFFNDFIKFVPTNAQPKIKDSFLHQNKEIKNSLDIFYNPDITSDIPGEKFAINQTIMEIYKLISDDDFQISESGESRRILPSDIAILTNTHAQASAILPQLRKAQIPAVIQTNGSVYDSEEAQVLNLLLKAINEPANIKAIFGSLTTFLFNVNSEDLYEMYNSDSDDLEKWILFFRTCQKKWQNGSFIEAFNYLFSENNMKPLIISQENGDRKITNLYHLQELIQKKEIESSLGISGVVNWFNRQINPDSRENGEDIELRLETDEEALKILTIHKSKGLEFPIVFCPFLWSQDQQISKDLYIEYHDENNQNIISLDNEKILKAEEEKLEEAIRQVYVALTRSKYKSYLFAINNKKMSALKYFLNEINTNDNSEILKILKQKNIQELKDFSSLENINFIECDSTSKFNAKYLPKTMKKNPVIIKHEFKKDLNIQWHVNSFSSLIRSNMNNKFEEFKDYDEQILQPEIADETTLNIFTFPAGAKTGSCWHEIFEDIEFNDDESKIREIAQEKLTNYGILPNNDDPKLQQNFVDITVEMVNNVLGCVLSKDKNIILKNIRANQKINELEFFFSVKNNIHIHQINELLDAYKISFNDFVPKGFLTGFIDLIFQKDEKFYILDWKSNALGLNQSQFLIENIEIEMHEHKYKLQYIIYTLALHKYLKQRIKTYDYRKNFGGVFYLFLRGVNQNIPESGIYYDLPDIELIEALDKLLK